MRQPNINRRGKIFRSKAAGLATLALVAWAYSGNTLLPGVNATLDENGEAIKELCEAANKSYSNITDQLVEYTDYGNGIFFGVFHPDNKACRGDYVLPIFPSEVLWSDGFRATLYALALCYCFLGVALISDIFMSAIEVITAKEVKVMKEDEQGQMKEHTVLFWNETIANLSLMALGSSAPEILLSVVETVGKLGQPPVNGLGPSTIVGSAAFNLLVITAICIIAVPNGENRTIDGTSVFRVTAFFSIFAYVWMLFVLDIWTPEVVTLEEAFITLGMFFVLLLLAFKADKGCGRNSVAPEGHIASHKNISPANVTKSIVAELLRAEAENGKTDLSDDPEALAKYAAAQVMENQHVSRARYRINATRGMTGGKRVIMDHSAVIDKRVGMVPRKSGLIRAFTSRLLGPKKEDEAPPVEEDEDPLVQFTFGCPKYDAFENERCVRIIVRRTPQAGVRPGTTRILVNKKKSEAVLKGQEEPAEDEEELNSAKPLPPLTGSFRGIPTTNPAEEVNGDGAAAAAAAPSDTATGGRETFMGEGRETIVGQESRKKKRRSSRDIPEDPNVFSISFETSNGAAVAGEDYEHTAGRLNFAVNEFEKVIEVPIIDDNEYEPNENFFLTLKHPSTNSELGSMWVTEVNIIDDDDPGEFSFTRAAIVVKETDRFANLIVRRSGGSDGAIKIRYWTKEATAKDNVDFHHSMGVLIFNHGETEKTFEVPIVNGGKYEKDNTFVVEFEILGFSDDGGPKYGEHRMSSVTITSDDRFQATVDQVAMLMQVNLDSFEVGTSSYTEQFRSALTVEGEDGEGASSGDMLLHVISLFWKILFAFVPPTSYKGGWVTFVVAVLGIGGLTVLVGDLAGMFGCCLGVSNGTTAITFVALGTSLPDTLASKTAAINDKHADASVGNVTGSNSVNVFLGLGLPWVIATLYHAAKGTEYQVKTTGLSTSVTIFCCVGVTCIAMLMGRRAMGWGELGGPVGPKYACGAFLIILWGLYIILSITYGG